MLEKQSDTGAGKKPTKRLKYCLSDTDKEQNY